MKAIFSFVPILQKLHHFPVLEKQFVAEDHWMMRNDDQISLFPSEKKDNKKLIAVMNYKKKMIHQTPGEVLEFALPSPISPHEKWPQHKGWSTSMRRAIYQTTGQSFLMGHLVWTKTVNSRWTCLQSVIMCNK